MPSFEVPEIRVTTEGIDRRLLPNANAELGKQGGVSHGAAGISVLHLQEEPANEPQIRGPQINK